LLFQPLELTRRIPMEAECGIFDRDQGWFEGMGVEYTVSPIEEGCMMHKKGACFREFEFRYG
jgi:hypothetical protein